MSKRRNKNKKAGPVTVIKPEPLVARQVDDVPEVHATPETHEDLREVDGVLGMQDTQDVSEAQFAEEAPAAEEPPIAEEVPAVEEMAAAEELPVVEAVPVVEEIAATDEASIAETDMPVQESRVATPGRETAEVEDASGALAQAIEVDPDSITSKPAPVESIRIIEAHDETVEMHEQGSAESGADSIVRSWVPVGSSTNASAVSFDLPAADAADEGIVEEPVGVGKKPDRRLKLNKLQKHERSAPAAEPEPATPEPEPAAAPKPPREPRMAAFAKLTEYQSLSVAHVPGLPEETDVPGHWRGVGFGLGGRRLVTAFDEVVEIMRMPQITHVPGTQPWMLGVANVRGTLLPVVDLKQFLEGERTVMHEGQRVLVVRQSGGNVAVLIDQLYGQRSFNDSQKTATVADNESRYGYFIKQVYRVGDNDWGVFSMSMLTRTPEFRQAAA